MGKQTQQAGITGTLSVGSNSTMATDGRHFFACHREQHPQVKKPDTKKATPGAALFLSLVTVRPS
jgi:hypothetical protein